ncbi:hypothetical protein [Sphaerisporangium fuscum]|uniref:hypothetical protein n=1 Tax=Sphaerisporangium fuscum TaxID=2835868 RepID=UPI001BDC54CD|nr:hypothetical protein [Sphaerisporangium fuscum]
MGWGVGVVEDVGVAEGTDVGVAVGVRVGVRVAVRVGCGVGVGVGVGVGFGRGVFSCGWVCVTVGLAQGTLRSPPSGSIAVGAVLAHSLPGEGVTEGVGVGMRVVETVGVGVGRWDPMTGGTGMFVVGLRVLDSSGGAVSYWTGLIDRCSVVN